MVGLLCNDFNRVYLIIHYIPLKKKKLILFFFLILFFSFPNQELFKFNFNKIYSGQKDKPSNKLIQMYWEQLHGRGGIDKESVWHALVAAPVAPLKVGKVKGTLAQLQRASYLFAMRYKHFRSNLQLPMIKIVK